MRSPFLPSEINPSKIIGFPLDSLDFQLSVLIQPKSSKESTTKRPSNNINSSHDNNIYKRLINPHPLIQLKIVTRDARVNITSHTLSNFFIKVKLINNKNGIDVSDKLVGNTIICGSFIKFDKEKNGVLVFKVDNLGVRVQGDYKLNFELIKYEFFNNKLFHIKSTQTKSFSVYKASYYYSKERAKIIDEVEEENARAFYTSETIKHLTKMKVLKIKPSRFNNNNNNSDHSSPSTSPIISSPVSPFGFSPKDERTFIVDFPNKKRKLFPDATEIVIDPDFPFVQTNSNFGFPMFAKSSTWGNGSSIYCINQDNNNLYNNLILSNRELAELCRGLEEQMPTSDDYF